MTEHTNLINEAILHFEEEAKLNEGVALEGVWWEGRASCKCYYRDNSFEIWTIKKNWLWQEKLVCVKERRVEPEEKDCSWRTLT